MSKQVENKINKFYQALGSIIIGQDEIIKKISLGLFSGGHILIEGVPGLAKTSLVKSISKLFDLDFKRISCTPDLLPSDLIGVNMYNPQKNAFTVHKGPIFTQTLLVDEINRAPAKVQSALLECMQEKTATIGENTFKIDEIFLVLATQNPLDEEGVFPLPIAEKDRFMMKAIMKYPDDEMKVLASEDLDESIKKLKPILTKKDLLSIRKTIFEFHADEKIYNYVLRLVAATRELISPNNSHKLFRLGASPRAAKHLILASKANAFLDGDEYVLPDHVHNVWKDVMRHRLIVDYYSHNQTLEEALQYVLDTVEIY